MKKGKLFLFLILVLFWTGCLEESTFPKVGNEKTENTQLSDYEQMFEELQGCYAFEHLDMSEKYWYADIYRVLSGHLQEGELHRDLIGELGTQDVDRLFRCVMNDHPELFYVSGYSQVEYFKNEKLYRLVFEGTYTMDEEETEIRRQQIEAYTGECLAGIAADASDYEKVKYVYEYIIKNTDYRFDAPQNQNICSVFISRESVCQGYAKAMQYLLERLGVSCTLVQGYVDDVGHAWNLVQIDGEYYYVDATWGDASYRSGGEESIGRYPAVNYDYLCVTTRQLCKTHEIANVVEMPECTSMNANYYVMEKAYFEAYDEAVIGSFMKAAQENGKDTVTVKCADEAVYDRIYEEFIVNQLVFRYLNADGRVLAYADNREQLSLTVWLVEE